LTDPEHNFWDTVIKTGGFICVCASLLVAGCQFSQTLEKEYKKPFWEAQLKLCQTAVNVTSRLARSEKNGKVDQKQLDALFNVFYGEAPLLMNQDAMKSLGDMGRRAHRCNNDMNKNKASEKECIGPIFNGLALDFSEKCRDMIIKSSDLPFEELDSKLLRPEI
jgi:hypothetical protein